MYDQPVADQLRQRLCWRQPLLVINDACTRACAARMIRRQFMTEVLQFAYLLILRGISCPFLTCAPADVSRPLGVGELGYMILQADKALEAGKIAGHLSDMAGERAIMDRCHEMMRMGKAPLLRKLCAEDVRPTIPQILEAQRMGDPDVDDVLIQSFRYIAVSLANVYSFVQPDLILVDSRLFLEPRNRSFLVDTLNRLLLRTHKKKPEIEFVAADEFYGVRCAALCAIHSYLETASEE